ncbi:metallophosphoesterase [Runella sp.]|jgi:Icc-related predicted phosphoesterase|uniref:metallophosphoesterase n=1 Tax=Runella sp. TaxID=1960881 RepID=UPI00301AD0CD
MHIQYCSDLHLEMNHNAAFLEDYPLEVAGDVLILAGDITNLTYYNSRKLEKDFFRKLSKQFKQVFWICGNHEFYRSWDVSQSDKPMNINVHKNVQLINNVSVDYRGVRLVFSTLWSYIGEIEGIYIQQNMSDFDLIRYRGRTLTTGIYTNKLHRPCLDFLMNELQKPIDFPTVVVTHHLPSLQCVHPKHQGSALNQGFASNLDALILETQPNYWIYGHSHANLPTVEIGKTKLITNQLGYCAYGENKGFNWNKCIEI